MQDVVHLRGDELVQGDDALGDGPLGAAIDLAAGLRCFLDEALQHGAGAIDLMGVPGQPSFVENLREDRVLGRSLTFFCHC